MKLRSVLFISLFSVFSIICWGQGQPGDPFTITVGNYIYQGNIDNPKCYISAASTSISGDITIPSSVYYNGKTYTVVYLNNFFNCTNLTSVVIPNTVSDIGNAFVGCTNLTSVVIPSSVTNIASCGVSAGLTLGAFAYCTNLKDVTVNWEIPLTVMSCVFSSAGACTLHVPAGTEEAYRAANVWKDFYIPGTTLSVSTDSLNFTNTSGQKTFNIISNTSWTLKNTRSTLFKFEPTSGVNNGTVTVAVDTNRTTTQRTDSIIIIGGGMGEIIKPQIIKLIQAGSLTVSPQTLNFLGSLAQQKTFSITSSTNWTVNCDASWLTITPSSGSNKATVTVAADANTNNTLRTATITVSGTDAPPQTITVTQTPILSVSPDSISFVASGELKTFTITSTSSSTYWIVSSDSSWLFISPTSGYNNCSINVTARANNTTTERKAIITVSGGGEKQTINVTQDKDTPNAYLTINTSSLNFSTSNSQQTFTISSNRDWTISSNSQWIKVNPASGSGNQTVTVAVDSNATASQRTAIITVSGTGVTPQTINVTQDAAQSDYSVELLSADDKPIPMKGVCADGESQLRIRLKYSGQNPDAKSIKFNIAFPDGDNDIPGDECGFLENEHQELIVSNPTFINQDGESYFDIIYSAPKDIDCFDNTGYSDLKKLVQIAVKAEITASNGEKETLSPLPIDIVRPPVLLIHGLGGSPADTFSAMTEFLQTGRFYNRWQILPLDYSTSNTASFETNRNVVRLGIDQQLNYCRKIMGYEAKKVDILAHSMGGLLTRKYLQSEGYKYDINKFITLNTPESGSQGANLLMQMDQYSDLTNAMLHLYFMEGKSSVPNVLKWADYDSKRDEYYNELINFVRQGAVRDLCVNSDAILNGLNGADLNRNTVPTHAIYTSFNIEQHKVSGATIFKSASSSIIFGMTVASAEYFYNEDLNSFIMKLYGEDNDLIVPVSSQIGGLNYATTFFPDQWHSSTSNPDVINCVQELLLSSKTSGSFSVNGFNPPKLTYNNPIQSSSTSSLRASSQNTYIKFTSIDKPNCTNNDEIKIQITGSADITSMSLYIQGEYGNSYTEIKNGNSNDFSYTVPTEALGYKKLLAIGFTNSQTAVVDTASITVSTSASLLSISTSENELWVPLYGKQQILVQGAYSDGTNKNITYLDGVQYSIKGSNASIESPSIIDGVKAGVDTVVISYQGFTINLPVQIVDVGLSPTAIESPKVNIHKQLTCYPNPAKDKTTVSYELSELQPDATINIYNLEGKLVKKIKLENQATGAHEETITVGELPKGVYMVVLSTNKGNSFVKLLKE